MKNNKELRKASAKLDKAYVNIQETQELLEELLALTEGLKALYGVAEKLQKQEDSANER